MEHLETQVSDLRAFLPGVLSSASAAKTSSNANSHPAPAPAATMAGAGAGGLGPGAATATTPRHPSQSAGSSVSAVGSNSAHPSPLSFGPNHNAQPARNHDSSASTPGAVPGPGAAPGGAAAGAKRKVDSGLDEASQRQQRSKRNRYISIACNECKRRKIKCNGESPCQRCGNLNLSCQYAPNCCSNSFKDSDEFRDMRDNVARLQEQVDSLFQTMNALKQERLRLDPIQERLLPLPTSTAVTPSPSTATMSSATKPDLAPFRAPLLFRGPTSASYTVDVAKNTLHRMGVTGAEGAEDNGIVVLDDTPAPSPFQAWQSATEMAKSRPRDPLWEFDRDEMIRLCRLHEEEVGIMYPVVNINSVIKHANFLASWMEAAKNNGLGQPVPGQQGRLNDIQTLELKIIMCCALVVEGHGYSRKALRLWESIQPTVDRMLMSDRSDITTLPFLALVGGYRFLSSEEVLAWRVMGQVARLCLEMGIHRRDRIAQIQDEQERKNAINTFWSAYVLDRRWSFGTGFPFVVHDDMIDPGLPFPDDFPYLKSMITFSKLGAKVWRLVDYFDSLCIRELKPHDFEMLDQEILDWYESVPEEIKIEGLGNHIPIPGTPTYDTDRLQIWTRLRLNQMRIWLYTPVLHLCSSIDKNSHLAQRAVDLAKETIQYLTLLNTHTDVYRRIQVFYNHFLTSAIACLFLASTHAPFAFSAQCREEFQMSMVLIENMSAKSWVSERIWRTIRSLKAYAPRLGLQQDDGPRLRENAAMTMAGMARMARGGQPPFDALSMSNRHGSMSSTSGGYQPTPSPGLTPGFGSQNYPASRTGSLPPHAGGAHSQASLPSGAGGSPLYDDRENGLQLRTEMSRMYEALSGAVGQGAQLHGSDGLFTGSPSDFSPGGHYTPDTEDGVYPYMREMF